MGANQHGGANFWRRAAAEVDASFLDVKRIRPGPRRGPAVSTISAREEADSNLRWARVQRREKLRGPVTITETLSLGLGAAALAAYASHGIPRRDRGYGRFQQPGFRRQGCRVRCQARRTGRFRRCDGSPRHRSTGLDRSTAEAGETIGGGGFGGRRAPRGTTSSPPPSCGPRARPMAWPGARLRLAQPIRRPRDRRNSIGRQGRPVARYRVRHDGRPCRRRPDHRRGRYGGGCRALCGPAPGGRQYSRPRRPMASPPPPRRRLPAAARSMPPLGPSLPPPR